MTAQAPASRSTKSQDSAPRLSASMPSAPLPAYRSSTRVISASIAASAEKTAPRTRSELGRVRPVRSRGPLSRRPFALPAITRIFLGTPTRGRIDCAVVVVVGIAVFVLGSHGGRVRRRIRVNGSGAVTVYVHDHSSAPPSPPPGPSPSFGVQDGRQPRHRSPATPSMSSVMSVMVTGTSLSLSIVTWYVTSDPADVISSLLTPRSPHRRHPHFTNTSIVTAPGRCGRRAPFRRWRWRSSGGKVAGAGVGDGSSPSLTSIGSLRPKRRSPSLTMRMMLYVPFAGAIHVARRSGAGAEVARLLAPARSAGAWCRSGV